MVVSDVSRQPIGFIFKGQVVSGMLLSLKLGPETLGRNCNCKLREIGRGRGSYRHDMTLLYIGSNKIIVQNTMILNNKTRNAHTKVKHTCLLTAMRDCLVQLPCACLSIFCYTTLVVHLS